MKTILFVLMVCALQYTDPTYTREPVTQLVPHCSKGYRLEQWVEPFHYTQPTQVYQMMREHDGYWEAVEVRTPEIRDGTTYRCEKEGITTAQPLKPK